MLASAAPLLPSKTATSRDEPSRGRRKLLAAICAVVLTAAALLAIRSTSRPFPSTTSQPPPLLSLAQQPQRGDLLDLCEEKFMTQELDHFRANGGGGTYEQRYFVCSRATSTPNGSVFFYFGAEADVELYVNNTGLMWENANEFDALLVFAEHRYFGKSIPFGAAHVLEHMEFLSSSQALADASVLIQELKRKCNAPVIGFGGSYGGMLAAWFRIKYPHLIDGVIAASAPVLAFLGGDEKYPVDTEGFLRTVTYDMSAAAGSAPNCIHNARRAYETFVAIGETAHGREELTKIFRLCDQHQLVDNEAVGATAEALLDVFAILAMGNYPYPSVYMTAGRTVLPAYPVRAACEFLGPDFGGDEDDHIALMNAFRESAGVFLNSSKRETCLFPATQSNASVLASFFNYIACSELYMPMSADSVHDVFPAAPVDLVGDDARCFATWGVRLRVDWGATEYGGVDALRKASNIVFSNGNYDPWSATGVLETLSDSVVYLPIEGGAHHLDLFFTHPLDPPAVTQARETEKQHIRKWIDEFYAQASQ